MLLAEPKSAGDMDLSCFYEGYKIADVLAACQQLPFFSSLRGVLVKEFYPKSSDFDKGGLEAYAKNPVTTTRLVFVNQGKSDLAKKLGGLAEVVDCSHELPETVVKWITSLFKQRGLGCTQRAARLLCEFCRADMGRIDGEIQKLSAYCADGQIGEEDVQELVFKDEEYQIFELTNAIASKNPGRAYGVLKTITAGGGSGAGAILLSTLHNSFKRMHIVKNSKDSDKVLSGYMGVKEYAVKMARRQASLLSAQAIDAVAELCRRADREYKSGKINVEAALTHAVLRAVAAAQQN